MSYGNHEEGIPLVANKTSSHQDIVTRSRGIHATLAIILFVGSVGTLNHHYHGLHSEEQSMEESNALIKMTDSPVVKGTGLRLFDRSIASKDAQADLEFVAKITGMSVIENITFTCDENSPGYAREGVPCAIKASLATIQGFSLTYFQSHVTPQGDLSVKDWVESWVDVHNFMDQGWEWNEWVPQSVTFYTPLLTAHVKQLKDSGVGHLMRRYLMDGQSIFSIRFTVPNSGHIIEIISDKVAGTVQDLFQAYLFNECPPANVIGHSLFDLKAQWTAHGGSIANSRGLPDLLLVQIAQPVSEFGTNYTKLSTQLPRYTGAHLNVTTHSYMDHHYNCSYEDIYLDIVKKDEKTIDFAVPLRLVHNLRAKLTTNSVQKYIHSTMKTMDEQMGFNEGFSRYADWNIGVYLKDGGTTLDGNADVMEHDGVAYYNAGNENTRTGGSNYARGSDGISVQYVAKYDYTRFAKKSIYTLDYCSGTGMAEEKKFRNNSQYCSDNYDFYNDDAI